jgi:hypothetical protein
MVGLVMVRKIASLGRGKWRRKQANPAPNFWEGKVHVHERE